jgi:tetratricopeptide (TPR) repeat protein
MMATMNSTQLPLRPVPRVRAPLPFFLAVALICSTQFLRAEPENSVMAQFREQATRQYHHARKAHQAEPDNAVLAWQFGRATFDLAEAAYNKQEREVLAQEGIEACRAAIALEPDLADAHYYLGMNLGQLARVYLLRGLRIVSEMEKAFELSRQINPRVDHGGADRNLGLLYHQAPGWPISVGNKTRGRRHLERAVELSPDYPENRLCLAEALWDTKDHPEFLAQVKVLEALLPKARETFDAEEWIWALAWEDWDKRWAILKQRAASLPQSD